MLCPGVSAPLAEHTLPPKSAFHPASRGLTTACEQRRCYPHFTHEETEVLGAAGGSACSPAAPPRGQPSPGPQIPAHPRGLAGAVAACVSGVCPPHSEASPGVQGSPGSKAGARGLGDSKLPLNL